MNSTDPWSDKKVAYARLCLVKIPGTQVPCTKFTCNFVRCSKEQNNYHLQESPVIQMRESSFTHKPMCLNSVHKSPFGLTWHCNSNVLSFSCKLTDFDFNATYRRYCDFSSMQKNEAFQRGWKFWFVSLRNGIWMIMVHFYDHRTNWWIQPSWLIGNRGVFSWPYTNDMFLTIPKGPTDR